MSMRKLTKEELELAPVWATHYHINHNESILFECDYQYCLYENKTGMTIPVGCVGVCDESAPIPKKTFDIAEHEFSDCRNISYTGKDEGLVSLCFEVLVCDGKALFDFDKDDAIAIAKALGATAEDFS